MAKKPTSPSRGDSKAVGERLNPGCRVALLKGPEAYLRQYHVDKLVGAVSAAGQSVDVIRFDGTTALLRDVLDECRSMGLMAQFKVVVVDDADVLIKESEAEESGEGPAPREPAGKSPGRGGKAPRHAAKALRKRDVLERYVQAPTENVTLVLRAETWKPGNLDKAIAAVGVTIDCDHLEPALACRWVVERARQRYQRAIEPDAVELLVHSAGPELTRIDSELAKLAASVGDGQPIAIGSVRSLVAQVPGEDRWWALSDALVNPDPAVGLSKLHEMTEVNGMEPILARLAYIDLATKLHALSVEIATGVSPFNAGKGLKLFGAAAGPLRNMAARTTPAQAADLLNRCVKSDWHQKTGQTTPRNELEALAIEIAALSRRANSSGARRPQGAF